MKMQQIKYLCPDCKRVLGIKQGLFEAANEAGRKFCERCGNNASGLLVIFEEKYNDYMSKLKRRETVTDEDKVKFICQRFGIVYHELVNGSSDEKTKTPLLHCSCGARILPKEVYGHLTGNPNFGTVEGKAHLLELMMKGVPNDGKEGYNEDWIPFVKSVLFPEAVIRPEGLRFFFDTFLFDGDACNFQDVVYRYLGGQ